MTDQRPLPIAHHSLRLATLRILRSMVLGLAGLLLWQQEAQATHAMGGELTYECIGTGQYRVR